MSHVHCHFKCPSLEHYRDLLHIHITVSGYLSIERCGTICVHYSAATAAEAAAAQAMAAAAQVLYPRS